MWSRKNPTCKTLHDTYNTHHTRRLGVLLLVAHKTLCARLRKRSVSPYFNCIYIFSVCKRINNRLHGMKLENSFCSTFETNDLPSLVYNGLISHRRIYFHIYLLNCQMNQVYFSPYILALHRILSEENYCTRVWVYQKRTLCFVLPKSLLYFRGAGMCVVCLYFQRKCFTIEIKSATGS